MHCLEVIERQNEQACRKYVQVEAVSGGGYQARLYRGMPGTPPAQLIGCGTVDHSPIFASLSAHLLADTHQAILLREIKIGT